MNRILVAPDSFKGTLTSVEVADCIEDGIKSVLPHVEVIKIPIADGGEGTLEAILCADEKNFFDIFEVKVSSPLYSEKVKAKFLYHRNEKIAIIEMAQASGLTLVQEKERNPMLTTTYGTGEIVKKSLDLDVKKIIIFVGGSATCDGGFGALSALGVKFLNKENKEVGQGGKYLLDICDFDASNMDIRLKNKEVIIATDVVNKLTGRNGASYMFSPQKGANEKEVELLDMGLKNLAKIIKRKLKIDVESIPGCGAGGGLPASFIAFCGAKVKSGFEIIGGITGIEKKMRNASLVITGEGRIDKQTQYGKVVSGVASIAKKYNLPVIAIVGSVEDMMDYSKIGIDAVFSIITSPMCFEEAKKNSKYFLYWKTQQIMRLLNIKYKKYNKKYT